ncbi:MAG: hypothetical protein U1F43_03975 [Myxococcota bacterium]
MDPADPTAPRTRVVDALAELNEAPITFRALCERVVPIRPRLPYSTRSHRAPRPQHGRAPRQGDLGLSRLPGALPRRARPRHRGGRVYLDGGHPLETARYIWKALQVWLPPGLFYFRWGRLAKRIERLRRRTFDRFGPEPVRAVQSVPQYVLMQQIAALPGRPRELARVWARNAAEQVIERADLDWLRARSPGLQIVLSSASPVPVVEVAAGILGADYLRSLDARPHQQRPRQARRAASALPRARPRQRHRHVRHRLRRGPPLDRGLRSRGRPRRFTDPFPPVVAAASPSPPSRRARR